MRTALPLSVTVFHITLGTALSLVLGCATPSPRAVGTEVNESLRLTDAQRKQDQQKALRGDIYAARALAEEALYVRSDVKQAVYWYRVGASFGDKIAAQNIKVILQEYKSSHLTKR